jgi:nucleoside-diphosphate-sugar epimerase
MQITEDAVGPGEERSMRVFVTGATGFIGSAVVNELKQAGYDVVGLARSDGAAHALAASGVSVQRGSLDDLASLRKGAEGSDGVIHTAFVHDRAPMGDGHGPIIHDFSRFGANSEIDRRAIEALGGVLANTAKPLVVATGLPAMALGERPLTEEDVPDYNSQRMPRVSEKSTSELAARGIHASVVRLPSTVHGEGDHGFLPDFIHIARATGVSAFVGDGSNRWPAVHRKDAAQLFRLALERSAIGARYHAVTDEGVPFGDIAGVIARRLGVPVVSKSPEQARSHFGSLGLFVGLGLTASSQRTREITGWRPTNPLLLADLDQPYYFPTPAAVRAG